MISTKINALTSIQHCLAVFLAESHSKVDAENVEWIEDLSTDGISLITQHLKKLVRDVDHVDDVKPKDLPVCDDRHSELIPCLDRHYEDVAGFKPDVTFL
jgi:hypothetical protein